MKAVKIIWDDPLTYYHDEDLDPRWEWHVEVTDEEFAELQRLRAEADKYAEMCKKLKSREREETGE